MIFFWIRLVLNQIMLRRYQGAEIYLDKILAIVLSKTTNEALIYAEYNNLFLHCLRTNLNRVFIAIA